MSKRRTKNLVLTVFALIVSVAVNGQLTVPNYTGCPNQVTTVQATWNNVSNVNLVLFPPPIGSPSINIGATTTFTISYFSNVQTTVNYTLVGNGTTLSGPTSQTTTFQYTVVPPPAMTLTHPNGQPSGVYCYGTSAQITAPIGGTSYHVSGPGVGNNFVSTSNIITFQNVTSPSYNGQYLVTTTISGCTHTGVTNISVSPNTPITVNSPSNVCEGTNVQLNAFMNGGTNFQWYDQNNNPMNPPSGPVVNITSADPSHSMIYTVKADLAFNGTLCPRTATTQINVVGTVPVTASVAPSSFICQGGNINLSANAQGAATFSWTGPQGFNNSAQNPVISNVSPINSGNYSVTAYFIGNFITCTTSAVVNVSIVPVTKPVINVPQTVCQNTNVALSANAGPNAQYSWFGPNFTASGPAVSINSIQPNSSGTYYVTADFFMGSTKCSSTSSAQLNVIPTNTVSVVPPAPVCEPNNANLQANATGANNFNWVGPNGFQSPGANVTVYFPTQKANGIYTVTAYFGGGNITCTNSNTVQLVVNPVLIFSLQPRYEACYDVPLTIIGPAGATSYTWTSSTGFTANSKDITFPNIQPKDKGTYTLNVSLGPCKSAAATFVDVLTPIHFTLVPNDRTICRGDTIILEGGVTGGSQNYAYTWNPPLFLDLPTGPKRTAVPLGSVIYNLVAHDIACPQFTISSSFSVTVKQPPFPDLELPSEGCAPMTLSLSSNTGTQALLVTYDFGGLLKFQRDNFTYALTTPGTYNLKVYTVGRNGCNGVYEYPNPIIVNPTPGTDIKWEPETPTTADDVRFIPVISSGEPISHYNWEFYGGNDLLDTSRFELPNGRDTSILASPLRHYPNAGKYPLRLIATTDKGCSDEVQKAITIIDDLRIFIPNTFTPNGDGVNDLFAIKGMGMKSEGYSMEITDRWGGILFFTKDISEGWDGTYKGSRVRPGTYIYRVKVVGMNGEGRKELTGYFTLIN